MRTADDTDPNQCRSHGNIVSIIYCTELKDQQKDRLTVLHSRLQQEAEKIRKWKTVTEMELKQKDQKLQEAKSTIDKQQKQMLDIQVLIHAYDQRHTIA